MMMPAVNAPSDIPISDFQIEGDNALVCVAGGAEGKAFARFDLDERPGVLGIQPGRIVIDGDMLSAATVRVVGKVGIVIEQTQLEVLY